MVQLNPQIHQINMQCLNFALSDDNKRTSPSPVTVATFYTSPAILIAREIYSACTCLEGVSSVGAPSQSEVKALTLRFTSKEFTLCGVPREMIGGIRRIKCFTACRYRNIINSQVITVTPFHLLTFYPIRFQHNTFS